MSRVNSKIRKIAEDLEHLDKIINQDFGEMAKNLQRKNNTITEQNKKIHDIENELRIMKGRNEELLIIKKGFLVVTFMFVMYLIYNIAGHFAN